MYVVVKSDQVAFDIVKTTRTTRVIPLCPVISSLLHGSPLLFEPLTLSPQQQQQFTKFQNSHHRHFFYDSQPALQTSPQCSWNQCPPSSTDSQPKSTSHQYRISHNSSPPKQLHPPEHPQTSNATRSGTRCPSSRFVLPGPSLQQLQWLAR